MHLYRIQLLAAVWVIAFSVHAAPSGVVDNPEMSVRELAPEQLTAIRAIGRNVLAAKKSAIDDPADAEQLGRLRAAVHALAAAELETDKAAVITPQGGEAPAHPAARALAAERRDAARADARALVAQLRERGGLLASRAQVGDASGSTSAGLPMAEQRAHLFERWADKLDAALAETGPARTAQLMDLRNQLDARKGGLREGRPLGTPTLQAVPSTSPTPIRAVSAAEAKPALAPVKAKPRKPKKTAQ